MMEEDEIALEGLSAGELVNMARVNGFSEAHQGMPLRDLRAICLSPPNDGPPDTEGPYDGKRREVIDFLRREAGRIQVLCHQDCFQHSDARVAQCWLRIKRVVR